MELYVHIVRNLTWQYLCFFKKQSQLFPCYISTSFYFRFSLNIFSLEVINPKNIQACLKDSLNVNLKLFPGGLAPVTQAPRPASQLLFDCHFTKNNMSNKSLDTLLLTLIRNRPYQYFGTQSNWNWHIHLQQEQTILKY